MLESNEMKSKRKPSLYIPAYHELEFFAPIEATSKNITAHGNVGEIQEVRGTIYHRGAGLRRRSLASNA